MSTKTSSMGQRARSENTPVSRKNRVLNRLGSFHKPINHHHHHQEFLVWNGSGELCAGTVAPCAIRVFARRFRSNIWYDITGSRAPLASWDQRRVPPHLPHHHHHHHFRYRYAKGASFSGSVTAFLQLCTIWYRMLVAACRVCK